LFIMEEKWPHTVPAFFSASLWTQLHLPLACSDWGSPHPCIIPSCMEVPAGWQTSSQLSLSLSSSLKLSDSICASCGRGVSQRQKCKGVLVTCQSSLPPTPSPSHEKWHFCTELKSAMDGVAVRSTHHRAGKSRLAGVRFSAKVCSSSYIKQCWGRRGSRGGEGVESHYPNWKGPKPLGREVRETQALGREVLETTSCRDLHFSLSRRTLLLTSIENDCRLQGCKLDVASFSKSTAILTSAHRNTRRFWYCLAVGANTFSGVGISVHT
jgi:hypothetical protein